MVVFKIMQNLMEGIIFRIEKRIEVSRMEVPGSQHGSLSRSKIVPEMNPEFFQTRSVGLSLK